MTGLVEAFALAVAALNAVTAVYGGWLWRERTLPERAARRFWLVLRGAQLLALVFAVLVGVLTIAGHHASELLFYLYALLPLAVSFIAEQLRVTSAQTILDQRDIEDAQGVAELPEQEQRAIVAAIVRREIGVMSLSALVVTFLALRAAGTAHGF
ncbi:MAG TPA: hypothetical protein VMA83_09345 [Solirubrobacteraceae bacterium]|nr:hypothetical protein [Solirubrobacteraceae bacterium]